MYLVLNLTNGDGYSSPDFQLFNNRTIAMDTYAEFIGYHIINGAEVTESTETKKLFISEDGEDNYGTHIIELENGKCHVVSINTCFIDEFDVKTFDYKQEAIDYYNKEASAITDISENEASHEARSVSGETEGGSKSVLLIFNRI